MSKKKITGYVNITILAGKANPAPPISPALGPRGVNIMEFCKQFNAATQKFEADTPIPVLITIYEDRSFTFITKTPPTSFFIKKASGIAKGSSESGKVLVGKITKAQCYEIAKTKMQDMNASDIDSAVKMVEGSARSMGIEVVAG